jgi:hypothetical protein
MLAATLPEDLGGAEFLWFGPNWEPLPLGPGQPRWLADLKYSECPESVAFRLSLRPVLRALGADPGPPERNFRIGRWSDLKTVSRVPSSEIGEASSTGPLAQLFMTGWVAVVLIVLLLVGLAVVGDGGSGHSKGVTSIDSALFLQSAAFVLRVEPALMEVYVGRGVGPLRAQLIATRGMYDGPIVVELIDLPLGMKAPKVRLGRGETRADIRIDVGDGLQEGLKRVRLRAGAADHPDGASREFPGFSILAGHAPRFVLPERP